ncbi:hypothetical protein CTI12_AA077960 [Artemisia annua]|uniref:Uncharacterized protein n=1 Tax=Artemisia annua TaxID=35608 RepID=A0A2U1Q3Y4_ARTAN|nr:hypothetical protein CTI12_AA077960 [Artemisia annua]
MARISESSVGAIEYLTSILTSMVYDVAVESPLQHASKLSERLGVNIWLNRKDLQPEPCQIARVSESSVGAMEYLTSILTSKVYDVAVESPLQHASKLSERLSVNIWLKREDLQPVYDVAVESPLQHASKLSERLGVNIWLKREDLPRHLTSMLTSKVYDVAVESPLQHASKLSERVGVNIWLKREDLSPITDLKTLCFYANAHIDTILEGCYTDFKLGNHDIQQAKVSVLNIGIGSNTRKHIHTIYSTILNICGVSIDVSLPYFFGSVLYPKIKICFLEGLDLCFGRYDTIEHIVGDGTPFAWIGNDYYNTSPNVTCLLQFMVINWVGQQA